MKDFQENIVPAFNQNKGNVFMYENDAAKLKILFVGNSITKHSPKADIGWYNDCGMAASSVEKDYVHLLVKKVMQYDPNVSYGIAQVAQSERTFFEKSASDDYQAAADYNADIVIMFFGANVSKEYKEMENPPKTFGEAYEDMRNLYLAGYSMPKTSEAVLKRRTNMLCEEFGDKLGFELKDFYELEIASMGIMRAYMSVPCDIYFTLDAKIDRLVTTMLRIYDMDSEIIEKTKEFLKKIDFKEISRNTVENVFKELGIKG